MFLFATSEARKVRKETRMQEYDDVVTKLIKPSSDKTSLMSARSPEGKEIIGGPGKVCRDLCSNPFKSSAPTLACGSSIFSTAAVLQAVHPAAPKSAANPSLERALSAPAASAAADLA